MGRQLEGVGLDKMPSLTSTVASQPQLMRAGKQFLMADSARLRKELEVLRAEAHRRRVKAERLLDEVLELQHRIDAVLRHEDLPPVRRKPLKK